MLDIQVKGKKFCCNLTLQHKVSFIIGDSGVGKTVFKNALLNRSNAYEVKYSEDIRAVELTVENYDMILDNAKENCIYIVDDTDFIFTKEFSEMFKCTPKCYFIFIVRTITNIEKMSNISNDSYEIYEFIANGIEHKITPINPIQSY